VKNGGKSIILTYHSVDASGSVISTSPEGFRYQMRMLAESGVAVVPLTRVAKTPGAVAITFDDGYANFLEDALPVLLQYSFPATVFVVSGYAGRANLWAQPVGGIPELALMNWRGIRAVVSSGISVGAHTVSHADLSRMDLAQAENEMTRCRTEIEQAGGAAVESFAFPYGLRTKRILEVARRHFAVACSTELQPVTSESDILDLPRVDTYYLRNRFWFRNMHGPAGQAYLQCRRLLRGLRSHSFSFESKPV
jgi:peptidoglycan/xylan/chitin deacetylase (PgdA/CDA1 family)